MGGRLQDASLGSKVATVIRAAGGNFLEMFDFSLSGFYVKNIAAAFFPSDDDFASRLSTMVVFGAGFLMRPLGALVLGGFSLAISTWLIRKTGDVAAPGLWMSAAAFAGLVAAWVFYRDGGLAASVTQTLRGDRAMAGLDAPRPLES